MTTGQPAMAQRIQFQVGKAAGGCDNRTTHRSQGQQGSDVDHASQTVPDGRTQVETGTLHEEGQGNKKQDRQPG